MKLVDTQIMVIDDDEVLRTLLTRTLETVGCVVHSCTGIKEALEKLKNHTPDLVILDLNMPDYDGFSFLKFRLQNNLLRAIPVMVLSGTKNKADVQRALELGANQFLEKPFESRIILQKLKYIFHSKENLVYRFPSENLPSLDAEIEGAIVEQSADCRLKIESQVKFGVGKSVLLHSDDYLKNNGIPIVCKVENRRVDLKDGFFRTILTASGLDENAKKHFEIWESSLSK